MRHGKKFNHLGRKTAHRSAMLSNMASSLIQHKRITTTVAKAKALRKYIEPIITKAKDDSTHSRRVAFSYLQDKVAVQELFGPVAEKIVTRPGGYTRILKMGSRLGDNAQMCMMELVDFNELMLEGSSASKTKTRRSRRGGGSKKVAEETTDQIKTSEVEAAVEVKEKEAMPKAEKKPAKEEKSDEQAEDESKES